jgi:elongation factor Tu
LQIDDVFYIRGRGTVVTGKIKSGTCKVGQKVAILKDSIEVRTSFVLGIEMSRKLIQVAETGDEVGLLLRNVAEGELEPGMVVVGVS